MSVALATTLEDTAKTALSGMLPEIADASLVKKVERDGTGWKIDYSVAGHLPSGREYQVPVSLDIANIYYDSKGAWLNSIELARELKKAAQAFRVAIALDGEPEKRTGFLGALDQQLGRGWGFAGFEPVE